MCLADMERLEQRAYNPNQPRDDHGRWTSGGSFSPLNSISASNRPAGIKPIGTQVAFSNIGQNPAIASDTASAFNLPGQAQIAQLRGDGVTPQGSRPPVALIGAFDGSGYPINLLEEENQKNHTVLRHVGKSDEYLKNRLLTERFPLTGIYLEFAGTFSSLEAATKLVNSTVSQNPDAVSQVTSDKLAANVFEARFDQPTGKEFFVSGIRDPKPKERDTYGVRVIIYRDNSSKNGFRIRTAFPIR